MNEHIPRYHASPQNSSDRSFGFVFAIFFLVVGLLPLLHGQAVRGWAVTLAAVFGGTALTVPVILAPLNRLWTRLGLLLHRVVSPLALGILFFGVVMPTGLLMRLFGKDPLRLRLDKNASSYWIVREPSGPAPESLKNQF